MFGFIKGRLLTYLFNDWLNKVEDRQLLDMTKVMITQRECELDGQPNPTGRVIIQGFKRY